MRAGCFEATLIASEALLTKQANITGNDGTETAAANVTPGGEYVFCKLQMLASDIGMSQTLGQTCTVFVNIDVWAIDSGQ